MDKPPMLQWYAYRAGLTHLDVARMLNEDKQKVGRWLKHYQALPAHLVIPLSNILGIAPLDVLTVCTDRPIAQPRPGTRGKPKGITKQKLLERAAGTVRIPS